MAGARFPRVREGQRAISMATVAATSVAAFGARHPQGAPRSVTVTRTLNWEVMSSLATVSNLLLSRRPPLAPASVSFANTTVVSPSGRVSYSCSDQGAVLLSVLPL